MENKNYELMDKFFDNKNNMIERAKYLLELVENLSVEKESILAKFFDKLNELEDKLIEEEIDGIRMNYEDYYFCVTLLNENILKLGYYPVISYIKFIAEDIIKNFSEENTNLITDEKINELFIYLYEKKFNIVYNLEFLILKYKNKNFNALTLYDKDLKGNIKFTDDLKKVIFFNVKDNISPIYIFFHEIGHYIHYILTKGKFNFSEEIINILKLSGFDLENVNDYQKRECLADVFAMGLMYNSPYSELDPFKEIAKEHKEIYKKLVDKLLINM